jgi:hypothetical protein
MMGCLNPEDLVIWYELFRLKHLYLSDTFYQATCFGPPGPSSGLYRCLNMDPNSIYLTAGIPRVLQCYGVLFLCTITMNIKIAVP